MANPLIPMEQAAGMLGMTAEKLTELRSNNEIFGYRDGSSWKFKMSELQRVADELGVKLGTAADISDSVVDLAGESGLDLGSGLGTSDIDLGSDLSMGSGLGDSVLGLGDSDISLNEPVEPKSIDDEVDDLLIDDSESLIQDDSSSAEYVEEESSVEILSKPISAVSKALNLDDDVEELSLEESGELNLDSGEINLADSGELNLGDSSESIDILDDADEALSFGSSSLSLAASSKKLAANDTGDLLDDIETGGGSPSDTGKMLAEGDDMLLSEDDLFSDDLAISDSGSFDDSAELSSDFDDSDLVLDDSDSSELVFDSAGSGFNLTANESGISLDEEPLELSGSDIDSLELPDDDDMIVLEDPADPAAATMMQEDDFNLTPLEEADEDASSGSQIIALEDSEIYADESSATVLGESDMLEPAMLDDSSGFAQGYGDADMGLAPAGALGAPAVTAIPEQPYTWAQVAGLGLVASLLCVGGMIAYDICRNMWMPEDSYITSGVLPFFLELFGIQS